MIEMITVAVSGVHPRQAIQEIYAPNLKNQKIGSSTVMLSHKITANGTRHYKIDWGRRCHGKRSKMLK